jgi:4-amino-4-deoxy-L-arabinose transferase-like glycosyltransferase
MDLGTRRDILLVVLVATIVGLALRLYFVFTLPFGWDGGIFLYWASLINNGSAPYRDFLIRDPAYIYLLALTSRVVGYNNTALALVSIVPGTATIPLIYKATAEILDKKSGAIASVAYSISPTVIWYNTVFDERTLMLFLSVWALWMLALGLRLQQSKYFLLYGLILGVGTFVYRGIAIYIVMLPLLLGYFFLTRRVEAKRDVRTFFLRSIQSTLGYVISAGTIFLYFSATSSFTWMLSTFGFGGQQESASYYILGQIVPLSFRARIFDVFLREWFYLIAPLGLMIFAVALNVLTAKKQLVKLLAGGLTSVFFIAAVVGLPQDPQASYGAYEPTLFFAASYLVFLVLLPTLSGMLLPSLRARIRNLERLGQTAALTLFWLVATAVFVSLFGVPLLNYYYYFAPIIIILSAPAIGTLLSLARAFMAGTSSSVRGKGVTAIVLLALLTLNAGMTAAMLLTTEMTWRNQSLRGVQDISAYIHANTSPQDEILVGNPNIALFAQRKTMLGITQLQIYGKTGPEPFNPMPYDPFHLFPNVTQIAQYLSTGNVKYIVADNSPPVLYIMSLHPIWMRAFQTNYVLDITIDGSPIYRFDPLWDLSQHVSDVTAYSNSTAYTPGVGVWDDNFGHILIGSARFVVLPNVGGAIGSSQVAFEPPIPAGGSYIRITLPGNEYRNLTTSYALADYAVGKSSGVTYSIHLSYGNETSSTFNSFVTSNNWQRTSIPLSITNQDLTIILSSTSGQSSDYDWLQIVFTLSR